MKFNEVIHIIKRFANSIGKGTIKVFVDSIKFIDSIDKFVSRMEIDTTENDAQEYLLKYIYAF